MSKLNDKELLELAAKAAGIEWEQTGFSAGYVVNPGGRFWNPLTDDGDALRLAVILGLWITTPDAINECSTARRNDRRGDFEGYMYCGPGHDKCEATRRAITLAAADIGRSMP